MGKAVEHTFTTQLSVQECAAIFQRVGAASAGGLKGKVNAWGASKKTGGEGQGFYTPSNSSAFSQFADAPDFTVGVNILRGSVMSGAGSKEDSVEMRVFDQGNSRRVELLAAAVGMGSSKSQALLNKFRTAFPNT